MQLLYNSDHYAVVQVDVPDEGQGGDGAVPRGGFEIVDKFARRETYLRGAVADSFRRGVQALVAEARAEPPGVDAFDDFIAGYTGLAPQPLVLQ